LKESGCSGRVVKHCLKVSEIAKRLARRVEGKGIRVNERLVEAASMLHDIGRSRTQELQHGIIGGEILRERGLPDDLRKAVERHVGAGIGRREVEELEFCNIDLIPATIEEKIVCYADKLVDGAEEVKFEDTLEYYEGVFGKGHPVVLRLKLLHDYFEGLR
jgi:uncharacterized protein